MVFVIAGGKTGGHIYPSIMIAKEMLRANKNTKIHFVGEGRELERRILEKEGFYQEKIHTTPLKGMGIKSLVSTLILPVTFIESLKIIIRVKPDGVLGVGGYSSGMFVLTAALLGIPCFIHEQNFTPGFANKLLKFSVKKAFLSYPSSRIFCGKKGLITGNPVRKEFLNIIKKKRNSERFSLLIFGGSQGSSVLNNNLLNSLEFLKEYFQILYFYHQTGEREFQIVKDKYEKLGIKSEVKSYFWNIWEYFEKADLLITRAGASTISEIMGAGKASILIPFSKSASQHQVENALNMKKSGAADLLFEEELNGKKLAEKIIFYLLNPSEITRLEENSKKMFIEGAEKRMVDEILRYIKRYKIENRKN
ncbi:MAG: UDP-N-acetylglucosamine--N-acetylmuramyl-(pentapeptide) pyrophosphoryl-undecaprenol N-acetylglucosamine transferase [Acidobacteriota bacterium]